MVAASRITAGFPPLRQRKPEPRNSFGAMRLGSDCTAAFVSIIEAVAEAGTCEISDNRRG